MTGTGAQIAGSTASGNALRDWQAVRDTGDFQYAPLPPFKVPETPGWLKALGEWLRAVLEPIGRAIGLSWPTIQMVLIALAALLVLYILWKLLGPLITGLRNRPPAAAPDWTPGRAEAQALLEDADRLAAEGRYDEAVHLLLQRSVGHIAEARPDWLRPASTAREITAIPALSDRARKAFGEIATRVERSLFALRALGAEDWRAARAAYADFALAELAG